MSRVIIRDWTSLPASREKYQLYLASREWAVLKEAVRRRSGGTCERCRHAPAAQVHHQTYERIYHEAIGDLLHLCAPCHEFVSAKRTRDPLLDIPPTVRGQEIRTVYLAGKITDDPWREEIAPGWSHENHGIPTQEIVEDGKWDTVSNAMRIPDGRTLALTGPFWRYSNDGASGGHSTFSDSAGIHAFGTCDHFEHGVPVDIKTDRHLLLANIRDALFDSDLIFAWINSLDCYGTLIEIGVALGWGKRVAIACPHDFNRGNLWIAWDSADIRINAASPAVAWNFLWTYPGYR